MNDERVETYGRRNSGLAPEKLVALLIPGAALAFAVFQSWVGLVDGVQQRIDVVVTEQSVLATRLDGYYAERTQWIERIIELERKHGAQLDRLQSLGERVAKCERP